MSRPSTADQTTTCYHCGETCSNTKIQAGEKIFCCEGCKMVYQIINQHELCDYYNLNEKPGISQKINIRKDKFSFLDDKKLQDKLVSFQSDSATHVTFYLPQMHCSSCLFLLENLHRIDSGIISSKVNFARKEADIVFHPGKITLRKTVEILTGIGYEPYISLNDLGEKRHAISKSLIYQLGIAGFCFANIMMMSFPEYLGIDASEAGLRTIFRYANMGLSLPVLLYSALPFYQSSWKSLRHKFLNIDAPIALAIIITFIRSAYEVVSGAGGGYFDSMTGIVFFMLAGRIVQDKTYRQLSFDRDYTSYFPIAVSIVKGDQEIPVTLPAIKAGDTLLIHQDELIPADGILTKGKGLIDYSFVTGESLPVIKEMGEIVYAGGKQTEGNIEILVMKEVTQSYLTKLWNNPAFNKDKSEETHSFVHGFSRYFTYIVFTIAIATAIYWMLHDTSRLWPAVTAIFIIACPCALLLSGTFTNGNILRILGRNRFYLRNALAIEAIADISHIVFDKTGTLTSVEQQDIVYEGSPLNHYQKLQVASLARHSAHPMGKALVKYLDIAKYRPVPGYKETSGQGIEGFVDDDLVKIGTDEFVTGKKHAKGTAIYISFENKLTGYFRFSNHYRESIPTLLKKLKPQYRISVLSGDNESEKQNLQRLLGKNASLYFHQKPEDKLEYIKQLQASGEKVLMIGDGLNDAGALKQSDAGIAVTEQANSFTPACDGIIHATALPHLSKFIQLCKANRNIITASFILSIVYNIIGLFFAVQGNLSPLIAAILMPSSSLSILLLTFGSSNGMAKQMRL
jgi:P-type Cu+ transporter